MRYFGERLKVGGDNMVDNERAIDWFLIRRAGLNNKLSGNNGKIIRDREGIYRLARRIDYESSTLFIITDLRWFLLPQLATTDFIG